MSDAPECRTRADGWEERDRWLAFGVRGDGHHCLAAFTKPEPATDFAKSVRDNPVDGHGFPCEPYLQVYVLPVVNVTWPGCNYARRAR